MPTPSNPVPTWAVVGAGAVARSHAVSLVASSSARFVGVVDPDVERAEALAGEFGVRCWPSVAAMAGEALPSAVTLAVPNHLHLPVGLELLHLGSACLVEKPLAATTEDCRQLIDAAAASGQPLGAILNMRYLPANRAVAARCHDGRLDPRTITISGSLVTRTPGSWRTDPGVVGSGLLHEVGVHFLDLVQWWCGAPDEVVATPSSLGIDHVAVDLRWADGRVARLDLTATAPQGTPVVIEIEAAEGAVRIVGGELAHTTVVGLDHQISSLAHPAPTEGLAYGPGHLAAIDHAAEHLRAHGRFPVAGADGARSVALCERVVHAAA